MFKHVQSRVADLIAAKTLPHAVHQGCTQHLLSLLEMYRVSRNDAVHPKTGQVNRTKLVLTYQSLPAAVAQVYSLIEWLDANPI